MPVPDPGQVMTLVRGIGHGGPSTRQRGFARCMLHDSGKGMIREPDDFEAPPTFN